MRRLIPNLRLLRHLLAVLLSLVVIAMLLLSVAIMYLNYRGPLTEDAIVIIDKGESLTSISSKLYRNKIISLPHIFTLINRVLNKGRFMAGEYLFPKEITPAQVIDILQHGKILQHYITFPEGITNMEIIMKLNEIDILNGEISNPYSDGYLLASTYSFIYGDRRQSILDRMNKELEKNLDLLWENKQQNLPYKNKQEALIMASIIEKETNLKEEKRRVAAVFINRLRKGMKLQADPTVIYAITMGKEIFNRQLSKKDLKIVSPYNTYYFHGLPPSPITNPGIDAIKAALNPIQSNELYFVVNGSGGHNFAESLNQHNENVKAYKENTKK